ncbi:hypothetical protein IGJ34_001030 [Enterococcus sp. AZ177]
MKSVLFGFVIGYELIITARFEEIMPKTFRFYLECLRNSKLVPN